MKSTFLPDAALDLDRLLLTSSEVDAEILHQFLAKLFVEGLISDEEFNQAAADFKLVNS